MKKFLIAGNWKMNTLPNEAKELSSNICDAIKDKDLKDVTVLACPPFTSIASAIEAKNDKLKIGAQNCHFEEKGAFTGELSVSMLEKVGCEYIIIGHSERRAYFSENDELINKKVQSILNKNLKAILCIGETIDERKAEKTYEVLTTQIDDGLKDIDLSKLENLVIAYEPVWAIGTGLAASTEQVDEAHNWIRNHVIELLGEKAKNVLLLYGGSMNENNSKELLALENVNGGLIGGASLKADKFVQIIDNALLQV